MVNVIIIITFTVTMGKIFMKHKINVGKCCCSYFDIFTSNSNNIFCNVLVNLFSTVSCILKLKSIISR